MRENFILTDARCRIVETVRLGWLAIRRLRQDTHGLAAIEFALIASFLAVSVLNVSDAAVFLYDQMEVNNATQMGAQTAWTTCDLNHVPATTKCPSMNSAVTSAIQTTSLGTSVTLQSGSPSEAYYCVNSSGVLQNVGDVSSPEPTNCSAAGDSSTAPADYVVISTTYTYTPIFSGSVVSSVLPATITATSWVRLGG